MMHEQVELYMTYTHLMAWLHTHTSHVTSEQIGDSIYVVYAQK